MCKSAREVVVNVTGGGGGGDLFRMTCLETSRSVSAHSWCCLSMRSCLWRTMPATR